MPYICKGQMCTAIYMSTYFHGQAPLAHFSFDEITKGMEVLRIYSTYPKDTFKIVNKKIVRLVH
jgi:hypothetical protein